MEIYNIARYQNISQRMKRLTNSKQLSANSSESNINNKNRQNHYIGVKKGDLINQQINFKKKVQEKFQVQKVITQEKEEQIQEQSHTLINDLILMRENHTILKQQKRNKIINDMSNRQKQKEANNNFEQRQTFWRSNQIKEEVKTQQKTLLKAKSDGNLKIDQILQSYNSYKMNKQKFLSSINKSSHQRSETVKARTNVDADISSIYEAYDKKTKRGESVFGQIDNIWNQQAQEDQKVPKFQRSQKICIQGLENNNYIQFESNVQNLIEEIRPRNLSRSKQIQRNITKRQTEQNQPKHQISSIISPRGLRIPGKICKNSDKNSTTGLSCFNC